MRGITPFPGLLHFTLDPWLIILSVKQGGIKYHFESLVWLDLGLNPGLPGYWRLIVSIHGVFFLCCYKKGFGFSFKVFLTYPCPGLPLWDFANLSLEISIQLFFFPFLFPSFVVLLIIMLSVLYLVAVISFSWLLRWLYWVRHLKLATPSCSYSRGLSVLEQVLRTYLSSGFFSVLPCGHPERQSARFARFSIFLCCLPVVVLVHSRYH